MDMVMNQHGLAQENERFRGRGGVSAECRNLGFRPAFFDTQTRSVYLSRFADGKPAPCHLLDGLPGDVILARNAEGRVAAVKPTIVSGFVREGRFYSRDEAARASEEESTGATIN